MYKRSFLTEKEKNKKRKYGRNKYHNMSEEKKQNWKNIKKNKKPWG